MADLSTSRGKHSRFTHLESHSQNSTCNLRCSRFHITRTQKPHTVLYGVRAQANKGHAIRMLSQEQLHSCMQGAVNRPIIKQETMGFFREEQDGALWAGGVY